MPRRGPGRARTARADLGDDVRRRVVADRVHRVQAQAVEVELLDPVERVVDEEVAHRARLCSPSKLIAAPHGVWCAGLKNSGAVGVQVVAVGAEVVVDDVEQHHQAAGACAASTKRLEVVGRAVGGVGRERQHAVVAPAALPGKVGQRHQLDRGDAERGQVGQALDRAAAKVPSGVKRADMQLVDHRLVPRPAAPAVVAPVEGARVDDLARRRARRRDWSARPGRARRSRRRCGSGSASPALRVGHVSPCQPSSSRCHRQPALRRRGAAHRARAHAARRRAPRGAKRDAAAVEHAWRRRAWRGGASCTARGSRLQQHQRAAPASG